jgi:hypothetical protein
MSAFLPITTDLLHYGNGPNGPITDIGSRLFDHLVGAGKDCSRHSEAERLGRRISHSV